MEVGRRYHIYTHANGAENIFREEENYRYFLQQCARYFEEVVDTYAYCLMKNHFHLLVGVKEPAGSTFQSSKLWKSLYQSKFSNFFSSYTLSFNKMYERKEACLSKTSH